THDRVSNHIWLGGEFLYRGPNFGESWQKASSMQMPDGGRVSAIAVSPHNNAVLIAGTDKGHIVRTGNATQAIAGVAFGTSRPREGWVTSIAFDAKNPGVVYATYGNFGGTHVFRSLDNGETWHSLDGAGPGSLPDIPVHSLVVDLDDAQRLYLGTDVGVITSIDGGRTWMVEETGFGPAVTMWLHAIRTSSGQKLLFAFTHGRGVWRVALR
ncbi:MAG TPA: hypothetical protein VEA16_23280, partial [Vicinamibacterales bacterium]|nr:hypothetical protein [Vicinamibacterales bacterium]